METQTPQLSRQRIRKSSVRFTILILIILLLTTVAAILLSRYLTYQHAYENARRELKNSAVYQARTFDEIIEGQYTLLQVLADIFSAQDEIDPQSLLPVIESIREQSHFMHIVLSMPDGFALTDEGKRFNILDRDYFQQTLRGSRSIAYIEEGRINQVPLVILTVPVIKDGKVIATVHGNYTEDLLEQLLIPEAYDGENRTIICDSSGQMISKFYTEEAFAENTNILSGLKKLLDKTAFSKILTNLSHDQEGSFIFTNDKGRKFFTIYQPLHIKAADNNYWFIFNILPNEFVSKEIGIFTKNSISVIMICFFSTLLLLSIVIWRETQNNKLHAQEMEKLSIREQMYRIVSLQSQKNIYLYDIAEKTAFREQGFENHFGKPQLINDVPDSLRVIIADECWQDYQQFFRNICNGQEETSVVAKMKNLVGEWVWMRSDATTIFDQDGNPVQAIVSFYDVTEQREKELAYEKMKLEQTAFSKDNGVKFELDLTDNNPENIKGDWDVSFSDYQDMSFNQRALLRASQINPEDRPAFLSLVNRERLIGAFYDGVFTHKLDYRINRNGDGERWVQLTIQLAQYPDNNNIKAFISIIDIDEAKRKHLAEKFYLEHDNLTGAYNRFAFIHEANKIFTEEPLFSHALLLMDIDNFKLINDTLGHQQGDQVLVELVNELRLTLRENDIIGRIGGDEFLILLRNIMPETIEKQAESICRRLILNLSKGVHVSVSLGISVYPRDADNLNDLYNLADIAMYQSKRGGKNNFTIYSAELSDKKYQSDNQSAE